MTTHPSQPRAAPRHQASIPQAPIEIARLGRDRALGALERLITAGNPKLGARRLLDNAHIHGIDPDLLWGSYARGARSDALVRQSCMVVPGSGGTGMCFVSTPKGDPRLGDRESQIEEIRAVLAAALGDLEGTDDHGRLNTGISLAQCLLETDQVWARRVCEGAGMIGVGTLEYLRLGMGEVRAMRPDPGPWPEGVEVRRVRSIDPDQGGDAGPSGGDLVALREALRVSYEGTLDCPELCGLRSVDQVIDSHRATGDFDPGRWWLLFVGGAPMGCCLLSHCPASESVELVYLGIGAAARGRGLGTRLLTHALGSLRIDGVVHEVTCAVDTRNEPAARMYRGVGFRRFDARMGFVKRVR